MVEVAERYSVSLVGVSVALVGDLVSVVCVPVALICDPVPGVSDPVPLVGGNLSYAGDPVPCVGRGVTQVSQPLPLAWSLVAARAGLLSGFGGVLLLAGGLGPLVSLVGAVGRQNPPS